MNILEKIIEHKKNEIKIAKQNCSIKKLEQSIYFERTTYSLIQFLLSKNKTGIIAEFKKKSPSKGIINNFSTVEEVTKAYTKYGASCLSILTDNLFFGGSTNDLQNARFNEIPILRKDFIIDEYQIIEAKAIGADVILLIAACLTPKQIFKLATFAKSLNLEVLLEIHNKEELNHICDETEIIGINNRNLKTFKVDINNSIELAQLIPKNKIKIAESGIDSTETISILKQAGFNGYLIGENFMNKKNPADAFKKFVEKIK